MSRVCQFRAPFLLALFSGCMPAGRGRSWGRMTTPETSTRLPSNGNPPASDRSASGSARADGSHGNRYLILAMLCLALLVVGIDGTIVNVALPTLVRDVDASSSELQWIVDAYTIVFASFLLIAGNTGDRLGRKRCFVIGLVIFGGGLVRVLARCPPRTR